MCNIREVYSLEHEHSFGTCKEILSNYMYVLVASINIILFRICDLIKCM